MRKKNSRRRRSSTPHLFLEDLISFTTTTAPKHRLPGAVVFKIGKKEKESTNTERDTSRAIYDHKKQDDGLKWGHDKFEKHANQHSAHDSDTNSDHDNFWSRSRGGKSPNRGRSRGDNKRNNRSRGGRRTRRGRDNRN